jgi:cysteinyl-tRNA synthetase
MHDHILRFDVVNRWLTHLGYKVRYVRNITDAGHFEEEGRDAVDKIAEKSILEKLEPMELVQKYSNLFHWAMQQFNCQEPSIEPTATGHIVEQIEMIKKIIDKGFAYEKNGSVYFDVKKYAESHDYGKLSGRILEDLLETTRDLEGQDEKENKVDFALWKNAAPEHIMRWASPWGEGFPGWHIECSAMACKYLGNEFDIHGGGMDLLFPHHESEIAQSTIVNGKTPVRYWMHNNMITINGKKMGKSYNNVIKLTELFSGSHELLAQAYHPMVVRFYILTTHYRSPLDFGNDALQAAEKGMKRLLDAALLLPKLEAKGSNETELDIQIKKWCEECAGFMNDDFSTAKVIANLFEMAPIINSLKDGHLSMDTIQHQSIQIMMQTFETYLFTVFALKPIAESSHSKLDQAMQILIQLRKEAKMKKDFATSDKIRNDLAAEGILLKDEKDGGMSYSIQ